MNNKTINNILWSYEVRTNEVKIEEKESDKLQKLLNKKGPNCFLRWRLRCGRGWVRDSVVASVHKEPRVDHRCSPAPFGCIDVDDGIVEDAIFSQVGS